MESVLGANFLYSVNTYVKQKNQIEEKNERINEFSFAYMFNPTLHTNKVFKEKVKACLSNTFGADTNKHINKILLKQSTRVLALVVYYEHGNLNPGKMFKVLSCVIYAIIDRYVCMDYLGTEIKKISQLKLGHSLKTRHEDKDYDNLFGIGIPDIFMNMLSCQGFINNNDYIVILKFPNRMSQYDFNKGFILLTCDEDHLKKFQSRSKTQLVQTWK